MNRIFLSYSDSHSLFVNQLAAELRAAGSTIVDGGRIERDAGSIDNAIAELRRCSSVVFVGPTASLENSFRLRWQLGAAIGAGLKIAWYLPIEEAGKVSSAIAGLVDLHFTDLRPSPSRSSERRAAARVSALV